MTSQTLETPLSRGSASSNSVQNLSVNQREFIDRLKQLYKANHQAEYLYIQAEADSLWIQLEQAKALRKMAV